MIYKDEKLHIKYVVNIIFDGASPWNYLQTTEMGSLMSVQGVVKSPHHDYGCVCLIGV